MRSRKKFILLMVIFASYTILSGMICGRVLDLSVQVKDPTTIQISLVKALTEAKIPAVDGKIPAGIDRLVMMKYVMSTNLKTDSRSKETFQKYGNKIHSIYINRIWLTVEENTMSVDLPKVNVSIAPIGSKDFSDGHIATFMPIVAGQKNIEPTLLWESDGQKKVIKVLKDYALQVEVSAPVRIKSGMPYPIKGKGMLSMTLIVEMTFVLKVI